MVKHSNTARLFVDGKVIGVVSNLRITPTPDALSALRIARAVPAVPVVRLNTGKTYRLP